MSLLNPGGSRATPGQRRLFGHDSIKRALQKQGRTFDSSGSLAGGNHSNQREIARRARRAERQNAKENKSC